MKIQAKVVLYVELVDGTTVHVSHETPHECGDNLRFAGREAELVVGKAAEVALRSFRAHVEPEPEQPNQPGRSVEEWREAAGISDQTPYDLPTDAARRRKLRDYTVNALDVAKVPLDADAAQARRSLLISGLDTAATDAELESFQALRRQIAGENPKQPESAEQRTIAALVHLLDRADVPPRMERQAATQELRSVGLPIPEATGDEWNSAIVQRRERKGPER